MYETLKEALSTLFLKMNLGGKKEVGDKNESPCITIIKFVCQLVHSNFYDFKKNPNFSLTVHKVAFVGYILRLCLTTKS